MLDYETSFWKALGVLGLYLAITLGLLWVISLIL